MVIMMPSIVGGNMVVLMCLCLTYHHKGHGCDLWRQGSCDSVGYKLMFA